MNKPLRDDVLPGRHLQSLKSLLLVSVLGSLFSGSLFAQTEPYSYYGGKISTEEKNEAIEACEYQVLVEERRCNRRANKSACIEEVHLECREKHSDTAAKEIPEES
ncbi:hypothetical protein R0137_00545 [Congregibacter brevis]|uniref:Secreted protein n=1 Tax=Congregibacter brevis TaxID=3081201 RepID=A0ABZ0IC27_9GAMM|nr:hypothetical protein R0137_00545 [Congregibacter sp. IMCC45268]